MSQVLIPILDILGKGKKPLRVRRSTVGRAIASRRGPTVRMLLSKDGREMDTSPVVSGWRCPVHEAYGKKKGAFSGASAKPRVRLERIMERGSQRPSVDPRHGGVSAKTVCSLGYVNDRHDA